MTDEQKREHISFLYRQLDTCGQILKVLNVKRK